MVRMGRQRGAWPPVLAPLAAARHRGNAALRHAWKAAGMTMLTPTNSPIAAAFKPDPRKWPGGRSEATEGRRPALRLLKDEGEARP
jgi:hypothetical protein